ncbi:MBL fold metallo-hydrolase [Cupriavidus malaysiensis]|uniref:MBL fold metallo-hydrolase n=1 Tax=Cupriavidus malaysiensis TaxID=367825 RepID=UPI0012FF6CB9|nr:MBL fold metallo-hydrolase [Cupriavidus malaysiensis]
MIHVHQCFNAVGHGTFFSGLVQDDRQPTRSFSWVYDCGSKRTTRIDAEIADLEAWTAWPERIDLFVLSHFDDDHVNGVERFLQERSVDVLALPYLDVAQRLMHAAALADEASSASTALFQLDPVQWLSAKGLSGRVGSIVFVRGGQRQDGDPPVDVDPRPLVGLPRLDGSEQASAADDPDVDFRLDYFAAKGPEGTSKLQLMLWRHVMPAAHALFPVELMFFNSEQPDLFRRDISGNRVARRSGMPLPALQSEIRSVMQRFGLSDLSRSPRQKWRDALRATYGKHFGSTSQHRNNISLCLLVRPLAHEVCRCRIFHDRMARRIPVSGRAGLLCLGDLRINKEVLSAMWTHFGAARWNTIAGVQVPHHGSRHSWEAGCASAFAPDWFVHCVPDRSAHHPHESVNADLFGYPVLRATYRRRVAIDYHFPP